MIPLGTHLFLNLARWKKAVCPKLGNNEVSTMRACHLTMHALKDFEILKSFLEARIERECPYTILRMLRVMAALS